MSDGPDFICVGMPKAGTGWLYDQLAAHPDFWMPPVKELVYLNQKYPPLDFVSRDGQPVRVKKRTAKPGKRSGAAQRGERRVSRESLDDRDIQFLRFASSGHGKEMDLEFYAGLFRFKGDLLSGDVTPPYWKLDGETICHIAKRFPGTKILFLLRDPIARVWSRICMSYESGGFDTDILKDASTFRAYIKHSQKLGRLFATDVYQRWQERAPGQPLRHFFFDDIAHQPDLARSQILSFLGARIEEKSGALTADHNRKAKPKLEMPLLARRVLVEYFADEVMACAKMFAGAAGNWPASYGL